MSTDAQLAQQAWDAVMAATVTPATWRKNVALGKYPESGPPSQYGIAHAALQEIIAGTPPPGPWSVAAPGSTGLPVTSIVRPVSDIGINIVASSKRVWADYTVDDTGDSAALVNHGAGPGVQFLRCRFTNVAKREAVPYGKHGIYGAAPDITVQDFYASNGGFASDGISGRYPGLLVERFECYGFAFPFAFFDEGGGKGLVTVRHGKGDTRENTAIWMDVNQGTSVQASFLFEDLHFTGPGGAFFLRIATGMFTGDNVTVRGCTMNGTPVTAGIVAGVPADRLVIA